MRILGLDLSIASTGWSILDNNKLKDVGTIKTAKLKTTDVQIRLKFIDKALKEIITKYSPELVVIEEVYQGKNSKTTGVLNRLNGAVQVNLPDDVRLVLIAATSARKVVLGQGKKHDKEEVFNWAVKRHKLKNFTFEKNNDETDSILLATYGSLLEKL